VSTVPQAQDDNRAFRIRLLCGAGGAEISGVDASQPLPPDTVAGLRRALAEHCVIFLHDQELTPEQQKSFARNFGPLALWDNRSTQHVAVNDYAGFRRVMDRVTIAGDRHYYKERT